MHSMMDLPNIKYTGDYLKYIENRSDPQECVSFRKDKYYFEDITVYNKFVKAVEREVRASQEYKIFINWVKKTLGINFCQVCSSIFESDNVEIELHHGPLFTLYDYVSVILNKYIDNDIPITTFAIADEVIEEHFQLRVQCVMLSKTGHEAVHNGDIFLNLKQGIGNVSEFIKKYSLYLTDDQKYRIARYIAMCQDTESFDNGILDVEGISKMNNIMP